MTLHVAQNLNRSGGSGDRWADDGLAGLRQVSGSDRKRIEEVFSWTKIIGGFRRTRYPKEEKEPVAAYFALVQPTT